MDEVCEVKELGFSTITQRGETFGLLSRVWRLRVVAHGVVVICRHR
jgi:hypothetical protein